MYRLLIRIGCRPDKEPRSFHEGAKIVERDWPVDLEQRPFYDVLELPAGHHTGARETEEVPPGIGGESPPLMRSKHAKCHRVR